MRRVLPKSWRIPLETRCNNLAPPHDEVLEHDNGSCRFDIYAMGNTEPICRMEQSMFKRILIADGPRGPDSPPGKLVHRDPAKNPPRFDLRKTRVPADDPDLGDRAREKIARRHRTPSAD